MKALGSQEYYKYYKEIEQKKLTNKIIHEEENTLKILIMASIMVILMIAAYLPLLINKYLSVFWSVWCMILGVVFVVAITISLDNKKLSTYTFLDQHFYLLYLMKDFSRNHQDDKKYKQRMYSILNVYKRVIKKNVRFIKDANISQVSKSEVFLNKIYQDLESKITEALCEKTATIEIEHSLDVLLNLVLIRINMDVDIKDVGKANEEIDDLLAEYYKTMSTISENKYSLSLTYRLQEMIERLRNTKPIVKEGLIIVVGIGAYILTCYIAREDITVKDFFPIAIAIITIAISDISKRL